MIGNVLQWFFWRYFKPIFAKLPIFIINAFISTLSFLQILFSSKKRKIMSHELIKSQLVDRKSYLWKLIYQSFKNQNNRWIKMCFLSKINTENADKYLGIDGIDYLEKAMAYGKGVIFLNPHFGPFLFALPALGYRGYTVNQVAIHSEADIFGKRKGLKKYVYSAKFDSIEKKMPVTFINTAANPMVIRNVMRRLSKNEVVFFSSTGRGEKSWYETKFLGRNATFALAPFKLAIKTGATLIPVFVLDSKPLARIVIEEPLNIFDGDSPEKVLEQYVSSLSRYVKQHPDHFGFFLYEMHIKSWKDDHPFFSDYDEFTESETFMFRSRRNK